MTKFIYLLRILLLCYGWISLMGGIGTIAFSSPSSSFNPYTILDVSRTASSQEIRRAFKQLAKQWHPDKNHDPEAELNFIRIKQAYELLSDSERRRLYDEHGITNEDSVLHKPKYDYSQYERFNGNDNLEMLFGRKFQFEQDSTFYHKLSITTKYFERTMLKESRFTPYILFLYNDWSFKCSLAIGAFQRTMETLEPLGVRFASVNVVIEQDLYRKIGASEVPTLVLLLDGHFYRYRKNVYPITRVVEFIREKIPYSVTSKLHDGNVQRFLDNWRDNRVRVLLFEPRNQTRFRYLLLAYKFRHRVAFGLMDTNSIDSTAITMKTHHIQSHLDTMLLFHEDSERVVASLSMAQIPVEKMLNTISQHQYLTLPRLSSQEMLEAICPADWNRNRKRLCVVLITLNSEEHNFARAILRNISLENHFHSEKVRFAYIYQKEQMNFLNVISNNSPNTKLLQLVVLWRKDTQHLNYEWIENFKMDSYPSEQRTPDIILNNTKFILYDKIQKLLQSKEMLANEAILEDLVNEHSHGIVHLWLRNIFYVYQYTMETISEEQLLAIFSLLGTIVFMLTVGYIIVYFVQFEDEGVTLKNQQILNPNKSPKGPELKLHELRAEKYNGMVRLLKPGCRTIILITDLSSRSKLIPPFHKAAWAYRKSKTLLFGHMLIEKGLSWYSELLRISLFKAENLNINPKNCIGTVLAINGHRKYFCMYHAKHPETKKMTKRIHNITKDLEQYGNDVESGIRCESDDDDRSDFSMDDDNQPPMIISEENLLDGLSNWLDRLFEGTTQRYYVNYWPDFCKK